MWHKGGCSRTSNNHFTRDVIRADGTLLAVQGIVTVPPGVFGERVIFVQDVDGAGLAVYLQRGAFPALAPGQRVVMFGYLRTRSG